MTVFYANEVSGLGSTPVVKPTSAAYGARFRRYRSTITLASQATTDTIVLNRIPAGSIFAFGVIATDTSLGSSTVSIGPSGTAAKYKAAAVFTATDTPTLFGKAGAMDDDALTSDEVNILTIAAAALPSSGILVIDMYFSNW